MKAHRALLACVCVVALLGSGGQGRDPDVEFEEIVELLDISEGAALADVGAVALQGVIERWQGQEGVYASLFRERPAAQGKTVSFSTPDGGVVHADLYGDGDHGVVLVPGGRFKKSSWADQARALAKAGFRALAIDPRGKGRSRRGSARGSLEDGYHLDVLAAVRYLRETGASTVSVIGASLGGWSAARASVAAESGEIHGLVLLAHSPIEKPELMKGRKLFVIARDDVRGEGMPRLPDIRDQYERAPEPKELLVLEGSAHAQFLFDTDQGKRLMQEIVRFLSDR